jgi:hypothetical protein
LKLSAMASKVSVFASSINSRSAFIDQITYFPNPLTIRPFQPMRHPVIGHAADRQISTAEAF